MKEGAFTKDGREYRITNPRTPRPWHNYLCNDTYLVNLTQHGTGGSFWQPAGEGLRVNVTEDRDGSGGPRFVYLRDRESGKYWSLTGAPLFEDADEWECRIGLGYQTMRSLKNGIEASWRVFVPRGGERAELWTITLTNRDEKRRRISLFPYLEMHLTGGSTLMDFIAVLGGRYEEDSHAVFGINSCVKFPSTFKAFLASDRKPDGATVSRDAFLGHYRTYVNPQAVERGDLNNPEAGTEWLGASLRHDLALPPGESVTIHCTVGVMETVEEGRKTISRLLAPGAVSESFTALQEFNKGLVDRNRVRTPDPVFDRWVNIWLKHQLHFVERWGRVIGRGFRDILQDTFGHRLSRPEAARACILEVCARQYPDGRGIRAWRLPTAQLDLQHYADSPSWLVMALSFYLKETGDFTILDEEAEFLNMDDPYAEPAGTAPVWEHVVRAQRQLLSDRGAHGLSLIHYGDWCDTMNGVGAAGRGESVMLSMQVKWGCGLLADLAARLGHADIESEMSEAEAELARAINEHAWDGKWYLRAFDDGGVPVGSDCPPEGDRGEGKIFLNPQSWALISGVATSERAELAVASALERLDVGYGMVLNHPSFTGLIPRIGQMTAMTPGFYENGSVYVHGNCFWIHALAQTGLATEAWRAFRAVFPDTPNKPRTDTEPFVIPNYYIGPDVARRRECNLYLSGWRTGSAAWLYMTALEGLLGVEADFDGLRIRPSLPPDWPGASVERHFRGDRYRITFERGALEEDESLRIRLDGEPVEGGLVPFVGDGASHEVLVVLKPAPASP
ncbi:MAG: GH36-type glycosyl hydrolase domain-containing protein [Oceanipulchritudo sp.]